MAYLGPGTVREFRMFSGASASDVMNGALKSAFIAVVAAGAILALTEPGGIAAAQGPAAKSDRISAVRPAAEAGASFVADTANRVTTIEKGAASPFSPESPFAGGR